MAGWERYMVVEQYALQKAKGYDQYVYDAYETMTIDLVRDGQEVRGLKYADLQTPSEYSSIRRKD